MNEPLHKLTITEGRFWATVRQLGDGFVVRTEHALFGDGKNFTEHDNEVDALQAAYALMQQMSSEAPKLLDAIIKKHGLTLGKGLGAEQALEMVEKGEVTL